MTDEVAIVYQLDYDRGGVLKTFALGDPPLRGDFEGIAVLDERLWLMTSDGNLVAAGEGANGDNVEFERFDTGLADECEFEGLAGLPARRQLALLCKNATKGRPPAIFFWHVERQSIDPDATVRLDEDATGAAFGERSIHPSGLVPMDDGSFLVVAARQQALFRSNSDGSFRQVILSLDADRHRQAEGLALTADGRLLVADEGGRGAARLAVYRMDPANNNNE